MYLGRPLLGLDIRNLQFLKICKKNFSCIFFFLVFGQNPGSGLDPDPYPTPDSLEMLDPDLYPDPDAMNPDPQLCLKQTENHLPLFGSFVMVTVNASSFLRMENLKASTGYETQYLSLLSHPS
jgi:hypothetical protein